MNSGKTMLKLQRIWVQTLHFVKIAEQKWYRVRRFVRSAVLSRSKIHWGEIDIENTGEYNLVFINGMVEGLVCVLCGIILCVTIIGIPIGKSLFQYAYLMMFPFGKQIVRETFVKGEENVSPIRKVGGTIANIIWFPFGFIAMIFSLAEMIACFF